MTNLDLYRRRKRRTKDARELLTRVLNDVHWKSSQRYFKRKIIEHYTTRIAIFGFVIGGVFLVVLLLVEWFEIVSTRFSGILLVVFAGLLGACFSILTNTSTRDYSASIEELTRRTSGSVVALRFGVGSVSAIILYFFFEAGLVDGLLFPDLNQLGFGAVSFGASDGEVLKDLLAQIAAESSYSAQRLGALDGLLTSAAAARDVAEGISLLLGKIGETAANTSIRAPTTAAEDLAQRMAEVRANSGQALALAVELADAAPVKGNADLTAIAKDVRDTLARIVDLAEGDGRRLGSLVPNADLSKLMVWSFLAGFSERLVAGLLQKVESKTEQQQ